MRIPRSYYSCALLPCLYCSPVVYLGSPKRLSNMAYSSWTVSKRGSLLNFDDLPQMINTDGLVSTWRDRAEAKHDVCAHMHLLRFGRNEHWRSPPLIYSADSPKSHHRKWGHVKRRAARPACLLSREHEICRLAIPLYTGGGPGP